MKSLAWILGLSLIVSSGLGAQTSNEATSVAVAALTHLREVVTAPGPIVIERDGMPSNVDVSSIARQLGATQRARDDVLRCTPRASGPADCKLVDAAASMAVKSLRVSGDTAIVNLSLRRPITHAGKEWVFFQSRRLTLVRTAGAWKVIKVSGYDH